MIRNRVYFLMIFTISLICFWNVNSYIPTRTAFNIKHIDKNTIPTHPEIDELNLENSKINNVSLPNLKIHFKGLIINSELFYEKPLNFRLISYSGFGKELDVGSNNQLFWFWSKNMKPPALFYSEHENLSKSNLKTAFNPLWIAETLGLGQLDVKNSQLATYKKNIVVIKIVKNIQGNDVKRVYLIDPVENVFVGHYIYDLDDRLIVSTEVVKFQQLKGKTFPKTVVTILHEENLKIKWELGTPIINSKINPKHWDLPNIENKINLKDYQPN